MTEPQQSQPSQEEMFRSSFKDCAVIVRQLSPLCKTTAELVELLELAQRNDAQLAMLIDRVAPLQMRQERK